MAFTYEQVAEALAEMAKTGKTNASNGFTIFSEPPRQSPMFAVFEGKGGNAGIADLSFGQGRAAGLARGWFGRVGKKLQGSYNRALKLPEGPERNKAWVKLSEEFDASDPPQALRDAVQGKIGAAAKEAPGMRAKHAARDRAETEKREKRRQQGPSEREIANEAEASRKKAVRKEVRRTYNAIDELRKTGKEGEAAWRKSFDAYFKEKNRGNLKSPDAELAYLRKEAKRLGLEVPEAETPKAAPAPKTPPKAAPTPPPAAEPKTPQQKKARKAAAKKKAAAPKTPPKAAPKTPPPAAPSAAAEPKTPPPAPRARVAPSSHMKPLVQEIRTSIRTIELMMDTTAGGKFADPSTKKSLQNLLSEWGEFKALKADEGTINSLAEELVKKVDKAQDVERKAKSKLVLARQNKATADLKDIDDKAVADAEAKAKTPKEIIKKGGAKAKRKVTKARRELSAMLGTDPQPEASTGKKHPPQQKAFGAKGSMMQPGKVDEYLKGNPGVAKKAKALAKSEGFDFDSISKKAKLHYTTKVAGRSTMVDWAKGGPARVAAKLRKPASKKPAPKPDAPKADAPKPPATTTAAPTKKGKRPNSNKTLDATYKYVSEKTGKSISALKKAAAKVKGGQKPYLFSLLNPGQQAELNDPSYGKTPTAQTPSAKKAAKSRAGAKPPATTTAPVAATVVDEKPPTQARQAAASKKAPGPQPSPNQINEKPATKVKSKAKAKPKVPASPGPDAWHRGDMTPRQKAADTRLRNERARVARMEKIEADMKAGEPKRRAKAARIKKNKANRKAVAEVFESEGLTPEQAKTKAGREAVDDMRKIQGKKGVLESSKVGFKTGKGSTLAERVGSPIRRAASAVADKIPPKVLKGLGVTFRVLGSAAAVAEAGRMGYNITTKGLAQAMRDDDFVTPLVGKLAKATRAPGSGKLPKAVEDRSKAREAQTKSATTIKRPTYTRADAIRREGGGQERRQPKGRPMRRMTSHS